MSEGTIEDYVNAVRRYLAFLEEFDQVAFQRLGEGIEEAPSVARLELGVARFPPRSGTQRWREDLLWGNRRFQY